MKLFSPIKKKVGIEVYGDVWTQAYLTAVSKKITEDCFRHVGVHLIDVMVKKLMEMSIDMFDKNYVYLEENKIAEKITELERLKRVISKYCE